MEQRNMNSNIPVSLEPPYPISKKVSKEYHCVTEVYSKSFYLVHRNLDRSVVKGTQWSSELGLTVVHRTVTRQTKPQSYSLLPDTVSGRKTRHKYTQIYKINIDLQKGHTL